MNTTHDVVIIGAGPAGLAAATTAAGLGLSTLLLRYPPQRVLRMLEALRHSSSVSAVLALLHTVSSCCGAW